jgi:type 1 glutamine amidotransferase
LIGMGALLVAAGCAVNAPTRTPSADPAFSVLVFTRTTGYRHESIPAAVSAIEQLAVQHGFAVVATEDPSDFTASNLPRFDAVVWLSTSGDVLDPEQRTAFEQYIRAGGGYVGVHAAADTEYGWPWYGELVGAVFADHPEVQPGTVRIADTAHPSTAGLPPTWSRTDEWYNFRTNPRSAVHVLATVDESTYRGGTMGADHPIAWCHAYDGGRSWYTAMGHTAETYTEPEFLTHLLGGIRYAALGEGACGADGRIDSNRILRQ